MKTDYQMKCYDRQGKLLASPYVSRKAVADAIRNARNNSEYYGRSYRCAAYAYDFGANPNTVYSKVVFTPVRRNSLSGKRTAVLDQTEAPVGMHLAMSPITQGYMLLFGRDVTSASVIERYETRQEAVIDLRYKGLVVDRKGRVRLAETGDA